VQYSHSGEYILAVGVNGVPYLLSGRAGSSSARFLAADAGIACCGNTIADSKPCAWLSRFA
jgi:hypothetical protein